MKHKNYTKALYLYGFYPLCLLIEEYSNDENYEECQIILDVLSEASKYLNVVLPTKYNDDTIAYLKTVLYEYNITNTLYYKNLPHYINEIKLLIR